MSDEHYANCSWDPDKGYDAQTPCGHIPMFCDDGHRAVELMLLSAASCLNFFLVEYVKARNLPVQHLHVKCTGELVSGPTRIAKIQTHVSVEADMDDKDVRKMVSICERACKVMNTLKQSPETHVEVDLRNPKQQAHSSQVK